MEHSERNKQSNHLTTMEWNRTERKCWRYIITYYTFCLSLTNATTHVYFIDSYPRVGFKHIHMSGKEDLTQYSCFVTFQHLTVLHVNRYISRTYTSQIDSHFQAKYSNSVWWNTEYTVCAYSAIEVCTVGTFGWGQTTWERCVSHTPSCTCTVCNINVNVPFS